MMHAFYLYRSNQLFNQIIVFFFFQATVVDGGTSAAPPIHMVKELESARAEVESLRVELDCARAYSQDTTVTRDQMVAARDQLAFELDAERQRTTGLQAELREAESVMQELIEDKKKNQVLRTKMKK